MFKLQLVIFLLTVVIFVVIFIVIFVVIYLVIFFFFVKGIESDLHSSRGRSIVHENSDTL